MPASLSFPLPELERVARMALRQCGVAGAGIALHESDGTRLAAWAGARPVQQGALAGFCTDIALRDGITVAEDAQAHGFLAGVALAAPDGARLATLCLFDPAPRHFGEDERARLADLAALAVHALTGAAQLRAGGERRQRYLTQASHELRTPLASILGFSELLLKREFDAAGRQELLEIVHAQAGRMLKVLNGTFDLARLEAGGRAGLRIAATPLDGALVQAMGIVAPLGQNDRLRLELASDLAPAAADPARLAQALGIVLDNALRYSTPGTEVLVRTWAAPGPAIGIEIRDAGPGMTQEAGSRLFESFYRGPGALDTEGTGLGMAIFREIMDLHGARVELDTSPGAGTALTILLPALGGSHG
ncbi:sensor histidine kinase KdpD [Massilia sp. Mn16-1_5]|uniref:sensor histidine kinase n=1 Tax=Massilia sp. Mn16-1_5 TaxID=2079199 RepID=UPI00109EB597|nr:HAMP domain-containing sensor histidine kinase [Massilia sp. Mn16-1_5]THC45409.1 hypothetical protein C2862_06450 [Massilia sp. Mn16-1_5]